MWRCKESTRRKRFGILEEHSMYFVHQCAFKTMYSMYSICVCLRSRQKGGPGLTTRQFNRRYRIPKGVHTMALESAMSPEGVLIISAPMLQTENSGILPWTQEHSLPSLPQTLANFTTTKRCDTRINNLQATPVTATLSMCQSTHLFCSWHRCRVPCFFRYVYLPAASHQSWIMFFFVNTLCSHFRMLLL